MRQKGSAAGIGCVLWNNNGELLFMFSKHVGLKESTKAEFLVLGPLKSLFYFILFHCNEIDYANAIPWLILVDGGKWKSNFYFNDVKFLLILVINLRGF